MKSIYKYLEGPLYFLIIGSYYVIAKKIELSGLSSKDRDYLNLMVMAFVFTIIFIYYFVGIKMGVYFDFLNP